MKAHLRQRFGASVAETGHHDTWQRSTLVCALVGDATVSARADDLMRYIESRCPDGASFELVLRTSRTSGSAERPVYMSACHGHRPHEACQRRHS